MTKIIIATVFLMGLNTNVFLGFDESMLELLGNSDAVSELQKDLYLAAMLNSFEMLGDAIDRIAKYDSEKMNALRLKSIGIIPEHFVVSFETGVFSGKKRCYISKAVEVQEDKGTIRFVFNVEKIPLEELVPVPIEMLSEALIVAADYGSVDILKLLLEKGADPNYRNKNGEVAIKVAFDNENGEIVQILMEC